MKTIRVRIAVAVNKEDWAAFGGDGYDDETMQREVLGNLCDADAGVNAVHFVEADIPVPESQTIEGEVKP